MSGTSASWDQPCKILPTEPRVRRAILRIERRFNARVKVLGLSASHLPSRVRSLIWIASAIPILRREGFAMPDEREVNRYLQARIPRASDPGYEEQAVVRRAR